MSFRKSVFSYILLPVLFMALLLCGERINYPLQRVVSLAPNITEMIYLLGREDILAGVTTACDYPEKVKEKKTVGGFGVPDLEQLVALQPDLVLYSDIKDYSFQKKMDELGIPAVKIEIKTFADLHFQFLKIGQLLGRELRAKEIIQDWETQLQNAYQAAKWKKKVKVYFELWHTPLITIGKNSYIHQLISYAGGENVAGNLDAEYPKPPQEYIIGKDPEIIFMAHSSTENVFQEEQWQNLAAVKHKHIVEVQDQAIVLRPGPRLYQGLRYLINKLDEVREITNE